MTWKSALFALTVVVFTGSMAVAVLADDQGMNSYNPADSSATTEPEQGVAQPDSGEMREPVETGAVPERSERSYDIESNASGDEPTVEFGGQEFRPDVDLGP
jgi:hypothetical protein